MSVTSGHSISKFSNSTKAALSNPDIKSSSILAEIVVATFCALYSSIFSATLQQPLRTAKHPFDQTLSPLLLLPSIHS